MAEPMPRRRAVRIVFGAAAGMAIGSLLPRTALAPPTAFAQGGNCIGTGQNCRAITCENPLTCCRFYDPAHKPENQCGVYCCDPCTEKCGGGQNDHCVDAHTGKQRCSHDQQCCEKPKVCKGTFFETCECPYETCNGGLAFTGADGKRYSGCCAQGQVCINNKCTAPPGPDLNPLGAAKNFKNMINDAAGRQQY